MHDSNWEKLRKNYIETDLFTRSGTEVGVSGGKLKLVENNGDYIVKKISEEDTPIECITANSDLGSNYPELNKFIFGKYPKNWLIGNYKKIFVGHINNPEVRKNAASGGIISGCQLYLLKKREIEGAITLRMRSDKPYLTEPVIAKSESVILESARSKYTTAPVNQILSELPGNYSKISYTGLPEQIASIRKLQKIDHPAVKPINYIFGIFYGEAIGFSAITSFLRANSVRDLNQIESLNFRAGEWPGYLQIKLKNGRIIKVKKFYANYLIPSHITEYSLYQTDYMSELADISVGDAWSPNYEERGEGWSVIIARTEKGLSLLEKMKEEKEMSLLEISEEELLKMHSHGIDFKKRGAFIRIENRRKKGKPVPDYGYRPINISNNRIYFEKLLGLLFKIFKWPLTIWILEKMPISLIGRLFVWARNFWKKNTKSTKKGGLEELKFIITNYSDGK